MNRLGNRLLSMLLSLLLVFPCFWIGAKLTAAVTLDLEIWFQEVENAQHQIASSPCIPRNRPSYRVLHFGPVARIASV